VPKSGQNPSKKVVKRVQCFNISTFFAYQYSETGADPSPAGFHKVIDYLLVFLSESIFGLTFMAVRRRFLLIFAARYFFLINEPLNLFYLQKTEGILILFYFIV